jgi:hypothetical protein
MKKAINRTTAIEQLIRSKIDTCMTDPFYLYDILKYGGISGFVNLNNEDLADEYRMEFNINVFIHN